MITKNLSFSKHKAVISAFGKEYVKTGAIPHSLHRYISETFNIRQAGDYGPVGSVGSDDTSCTFQGFMDFMAASMKAQNQSHCLS